MTTHPPSPPAGLILPSYERPRGLHPPLDSPGLPVHRAAGAVPAAAGDRRSG